MRVSCTPQMVSDLARSAGFEFTLERCELLTPQLDWLLAQGDLLTELGLETEESVLTLHPNAAVIRVNREPEHG